MDPVAMDNMDKGIESKNECIKFKKNHVHEQWRKDCFYIPKQGIIF